MSALLGLFGTTNEGHVQRLPPGHLNCISVLNQQVIRVYDAKTYMDFRDHLKTHLTVSGRLPIPQHFAPQLPLSPISPNHPCL